MIRTTEDLVIETGTETVELVIKAGAVGKINNAESKEPDLIGIQFEDVKEIIYMDAEDFIDKVEYIEEEIGLIVVIAF